MELVDMPCVPNAKLTSPPLPSDFVERAELLAELDAADPAAVTLVCAPPGYGKTLLLSHWAARPSAVETAWVGIDSDDDDPRRLWASVVAALAATTSATRSLPAMRSIPSPLVWSAAEHANFVAQLVDGLSSLPEPITLVLDDVAEVTDPEALHGLRIFLRDRPRQVRVVLSSTVDPPVGLNRLRLSAQLKEIRADRMCFTPVETATLLENAGLDMTPPQVAGLHHRTGGWAAALRLATIAIADAPDPDTFIAEFSGDDRCVADYLTGEVINHLPSDTLAFLRAISVADPISSGLAAELSGRDDAGAVLVSLEHESSLVSAAGGRRDLYTIQPLLRSYLLADLRRHGPKRVRELHVAAARWLAADNAPVDALEHARKSDDTALLSELVPGYAVGLVLSGERQPLRRALDGLGREAIANDPQLALVSAITNLEAGDIVAGQNDFRDACDSWPVHSTANLVVLRRLVEQLGAAAVGQTTGPTNIVAVGDGDIARTPELEALTRFSRGTADLLERGDALAARTELAAALDLARRHGFDYLAMQVLTLLGLVAVDCGDLRAVREMCSQATATAANHDWKDSVWFSAATAMLAFTELQRAEPSEAQRLAAEALDACSPAALPLLRLALKVVYGAALCDSGDGVSGLAAMQQARREFADRHGSRTLLAATALLEFHATLQFGHKAAATTVRSWLDARAGDCAELDLMRAWTEAAEDHGPQSRAQLRPVLEGTTPALLPHTAVEAWLLESGLCASSGQRTAARHALHMALGLAEPINALRPFTKAAPGVRAMLVAQQGSFGEYDTFAAQAARAATDARTPVQKVLSEREWSVLAMLPSLLPLADIAADLTVSVNTVKSHVRSIYTKLGVSSRRDAVFAAYEHGLLTISARPVDVGPPGSARSGGDGLRSH